MVRRSNGSGITFFGMTSDEKGSRDQREMRPNANPMWRVLFLRTAFGPPRHSRMAAPASGHPAILRTLGGWRSAPSAPPLATGFPPPRFFTQQLDHFAADQPRTWQQAYFVNDTFWKVGGPVFLCVGGEGPPLTGAAVSSSVHCNVAVEHLQEFGALMLALEHRFYGCHNSSACPYTADDAKPLRWLSSRQALADIAALHAHITSELKLPPTTKWVTFGGSYPGMLASWARLLYPNLIHASISSSAPVHAKLDMPEYNDLVARAYSLPSVGGSDACRHTIAAGHATIGKLMRTAIGRAILVSKFATLRGLGAAWLEPRSHRARFAGEGVASFPAQSNDPSCGFAARSIGKICALLAHTPGSAVDKLAALSSAQLQAGIIQPHVHPAAAPAAGTQAGQTGAGARVATEGMRRLGAIGSASAGGGPDGPARADAPGAAVARASTEVPAAVGASLAHTSASGEQLDDWGHQTKGTPPLGAIDTAGVSNASNASLARAGAIGEMLDYWGYQTCTEFGFYQTCETGSSCFFTQGLIDLNSSLSFCNSDYNISQGEIAKAINVTNAFYGGLRPDLRFGAQAAARILYVNGDVDPWSSLSILSSPLDGAGTGKRGWFGPGQSAVRMNTSVIENEIDGWDTNKLLGQEREIETPTLSIIPNVSGSSHHFWTHPTKPTDQKSVVEARRDIVAQLRSWLDEEWEPAEASQDMEK